VFFFFFFFVFYKNRIGVFVFEKKNMSKVEESSAVKLFRKYFTYIKDEDVPVLANWKYVAGEYTPLDLLMNPWWVWCETKVPKWISANAVSFTAATTMSLWTLCLACCVGTAEDTRIYSLISLLVMFFYQTADAVDGKHARRLNMTSPFGSMLDHGADSLTMFLISVLVMFSMSPDLEVSGWCLASVNWGLVTFFLAHWECRFEGHLVTGGVTESQFIGMSIFLPSIIFGQSVWDEYEWGVDIVSAITTIVAALIGLQAMYRVFTKFDFKEPLIQLTPVIVLNMIVYYMWTSGVYSASPKFAMGCIGMTYVITTLRWVIGNMANVELNIAHIFIPIVLLGVAVLFPVLLPALLLINVLLFIFVATDTTFRMCHGLKIPIILVKLEIE